MPIRILIIPPFAMLTMFILFTGCKSQEEVKVNSSLTVDADMIKNIDLEKDDFTEYIDDQIDAVTVDIIAGTTNRTNQRAAIEMKKFFNKRMIKYENIEDPRKTFLNVWSLIKRYQNYISEGDGKTLFGDQQKKVVETVAGLQSHIEQIAEKHLTQKQLKRIDRDLQNYVKNYPIKGYFQDAPELSSTGFADVLQIPLAPFRAVNAINEGRASIEDISKTVARFTDIAEDLPDEIRWQLQVLAVQLQQNDILKTNTDSFQKLAQTSEQLVKIVDQYPDKISEKVKKAAKDLEKTINQLNEISKQIDTSMSKLQTSSENFQKLGESVNESSDKIITSLKHVEKSSLALSKAAEAVSTAMKDIQSFSEYLDKNSDKSEKSEKKDPFLIQVEKASTALEKSAAEVSTTLQKIIELSDKKPFSEEINSFDQKAKDTLIITREESQSLVDYIFQKSLILVALIFVLTMIIIVTKSRLAKTA